MDKHCIATDNRPEDLLLEYTEKEEVREAMLKMKALCLGALVIMATLLVSSEGQRYPRLIGCFEAHQNCFDDDCQKRCDDADFGKRVRGRCQADPNLTPYNAIDCCCFLR